MIEQITKAQQSAAQLASDLLQAYHDALNVVRSANFGPIPATPAEKALLAYLGERLAEARTIESKLTALDGKDVKEVHGEPEPNTKTVFVVFDGPPGPQSGRFVEVEDEKVCGLSIGEWVQRDSDKPHGYWSLKFDVVQK